MTKPKGILRIKNDASTETMNAIKEQFKNLKFREAIYTPVTLEQIEKEIKEVRPIQIDLEYPRNDNQPKTIKIGLMDVRAADGLEVSYDFERDGWVIKQPYTKMIKHEGNNHYSEECYWKEVSFLQAWALEHLNEDRSEGE